MTMDKLKLAVTGAGSAQSNGVIRCLQMDKQHPKVLGLGSDKYDLMLSPADKKILVPHSKADNYKEQFLEVLKAERPDMMFFQHEKELLKASSFRDEIEALGIKFYIPDNNTITTCVHKYKSWEKFKQAGIKVPENLVINNESDLQRAFRELGESIWIRSTAIGGGGIGSLAANSYEEAYEWIEKNQGWGTFIAAELLSDKTITWQSVWNNGELVVAQGRRRYSWAFGALSASGVTGITRVCETVSDSMVDEIGIAACKAVSEVPHGVYGVDMTYDFDGIPNPTEINIGRFFTTVRFFAEAGLNLPVIIKDICLEGKMPDLPSKLNPLPDGLLWLRGMDEPPRLTTADEIDKTVLRRYKSL